MQAHLLTTKQDSQFLKFHFPEVERDTYLQPNGTVRQP